MSRALQLLPVFGLTVVAVLAYPVSVGAQNASLAAYFQLWSTERAQINLRKQAACVVRKYPADAQRVVVDDLSMRVIMSTMPKVLRPCGDGALFKHNMISMSQPVLELVFAEALLASMPEGTPLDVVRAVPPLPRETVPKQDMEALPRDLRESLELNAAAQQLDAMAECAVRRNPQAAWSLARSRPYSPDERAALQRYDASFHTCDPTPAEAPQFILRGIVAYNLYRLLKAASPVQASAMLQGAR